MAMAVSSFILKNLSAVPHLPVTNSRKFGAILAKRTDSADTSTSRRNQPAKFPSLTVPSPLLARSVVSVLGLGFIDAGYSGDWSRIGVITKESEDLLKIAAFFVVPFCIFLMFSFSKETD